MPSKPTSPAVRCCLRTAVVMALAMMLGGCKSEEKAAERKPLAPPSAKTFTPAPDSFRPRLAMARVSAAAVQTEKQHFAEAVALLVDGLKIDPACAPAREAVAKALGETRWYFPALELQHPMPVDHMFLSWPALDLWVSLRDQQRTTTVRWRLPLEGSDAVPAIQSTLFPVPACDSKALIVAPATRDYAVIARGEAALLCHAMTLKPICDLGSIPLTAAPESLITFSVSGLLLAHPSFATADEGSLLWSIRDTATGEVIRTSPPLPIEDPRPLCAYLNDTKLRVLRTDGSLWEMPISPVGPIVVSPPTEPIELVQARFEKDDSNLTGKAADVAIYRSPIEPPRIQEHLPLEPRLESGIKKGNSLPEFPWSLQPGLWSGPLGAIGAQAIEGRVWLDRKSKATALVCKSPIQAVAGDVDNDTLVVGEQSGLVTIHRSLVQPMHRESTAPEAALSQSDIQTLECLAQIVTGMKYDESSDSMISIPVEERLNAVDSLSPEILDAIFPSLDFRPLLASIKRSRLKQTDASSLQLLTDRLARSNMPATPEASIAKLVEVLGQADDAAALSAIHDAGTSGLPAATALALALQSEHANWIQASLATAPDMPVLLKRLAVSRIARLEGRKADALAIWPGNFPDLTYERSTQDWDGWEQADFTGVYEQSKQWVGEELAAIEVPKDSTPEQRREVAARLLDPATLAGVGRARHMMACMRAALALSTHKEEAETTFQLAKMARDSGAPPEPCLRAEAQALTALGEYNNAHPRWIELITEHPLETQEPGDYAEAAYTAFENADPQQAMQILTTGMHRFPRDGNFALRAGWVALLTGNSARAYQFLTTGRMIGFPPEKAENATALLTIAASLVGATDDADAYFQELLKIDPAWGDAKTLDTLDWPEELEDALRQYMQ